MIQILGTPRTPTTQAPTTQDSSWNSVHNSTYFKFQRKDANVVNAFADTSVTPNKLAFEILDSASIGWSVGDSIYVPLYNQVTEISQLNVNYTGQGKTRIVTNLTFSGLTNLGYVNNLTYFKGYFMEFRVITINSVSNVETIHEPFPVYPDLSGLGYALPHGYAMRELKKKNKNTYSSTNWNDRYAWTEYRLEVRERYVGQPYIPSFNSIDGISQTGGTFGQYILNHDFSSGNSSGWSLALMTTNPNGINGFELITTGDPTGGLAAPTFNTTPPIIGGETYLVTISVRVEPITIGSAYELRVEQTTTSQILYTTTTNGTQSFFWTPVTNGEEFWIVWGFNTQGAIWKCSVEKYVSGNIVDPKLYYATNSVRQIQSKYDTNMLEHLCVYATIPADINRGKFISDFERPTKFKGYPFDIGFIMHESMLGGAASSKEQIKNFNNIPQGINTFKLVDYTKGEHRLILKSTYADSDTSIDVWIEANALNDNLYVDELYVDTGYVEDNIPNPPPLQTGKIMQTMNIKLDNKCKENPVYVAWKGRKGAMNYWLFSKTQTIGSVVGEVQKYEPYFIGLDTDTKQSVLTKSDKPTMVVGAQFLDLNDIKGLIGLSVSNFVQMWIKFDGKSGHIWQTINIKEGSFKYYETGNGMHEIEMTIELVENYVHIL